MLVLLPKDSKEVNALLKHIQRQVLCSNKKSAALVLLSSTETNEYILKDFHYVGEESVELNKTSDSQTICLWKIGEFSKFRPLFGGKETDLDDEIPAQGFIKPPLCFSRMC